MFSDAGSTPAASTIVYSIISVGYFLPEILPNCIQSVFNTVKLTSHSWEGAREAKHTPLAERNGRVPGVTPERKCVTTRGGPQAWEGSPA